MARIYRTQKHRRQQKTSKASVIKQIKELSDSFRRPTLLTATIYYEKSGPYWLCSHPLTFLQSTISQTDQYYQIQYLALVKCERALSELEIDKTLENALCETYEAFSNFVTQNLQRFWFPDCIEASNVSLGAMVFLLKAYLCASQYKKPQYIEKMQNLLDRLQTSGYIRSPLKGPAPYWMVKSIEILITDHLSKLELGKAFTIFEYSLSALGVKRSDFHPDILSSIELYSKNPNERHRTYFANLAEPIRRQQHFVDVVRFSTPPPLSPYIPNRATTPPVLPIGGWHESEWEFNVNNANPSKLKLVL